MIIKILNFNLWGPFLSSPKTQESWKVTFFPSLHTQDSLSNHFKVDFSETRHTFQLAESERKILTSDPQSSSQHEWKSEVEAPPRSNWSGLHSKKKKKNPIGARRTEHVQDYTSTSLKLWCGEVFSFWCDPQHKSELILFYFWAKLKICEDLWATVRQELPRDVSCSHLKRKHPLFVGAEIIL